MSARGCIEAGGRFAYWRLASVVRCNSPSAGAVAPSVIPKRRGLLGTQLTLCVAALCLLMGACNRVPSTGVPRLSQVLKSEGALLAEQPNQAPIEPLCVRACGHWVDLQFKPPMGWDRITAEETQRMSPLLDRQRALNRAFCEEACVSAQDRLRARCILRADTVAECEACTLQ